MEKPKYNIGEEVYHITPESDKGIVIDATYYLFSGKWMYQVAFSPTITSLWYYEHELSKNKTF